MVSIVIPTLFPSAQLEQYAERLVKYKQVKEVVVVVNRKDKTPSPAQILERELPQGSKSFPRGGIQKEKGVMWHFLGRNRGFTGACNAGARSAVGDLILFLNDDCEMAEDAFLALVDFMEKNTDVVATQPIVTKVTVNSNSKQVENIGFWVDTGIGKAYPVTVNSNNEQEHRDTRKGSFNLVQDDTKPESLASSVGKLNTSPSNDCRLTTDDFLYGLSGTCLLIRKDVFLKVGMWDESFHSYLEDVDLAIRLHKAGYRVAPCLDAEVTHTHMATSSKMGLYKEVQDVKNWWRLILKHPDIFVHWSDLFILLLERGRNMSGLAKKFLRI